MAGSRRKFYNEELYNSYLSPYIIRVIKIEEDEVVKACSAHGEIREKYRISVGKSVGEELLRRPRRRWEGNNEKLVFREIDLGGRGEC